MSFWDLQTKHLQSHLLPAFFPAGIFPLEGIGWFWHHLGIRSEPMAQEHL